MFADPAERRSLPRGSRLQAKARSRTSFYLFLVGLVMASGTVVLIEPAPIDIGLILLLVAGLLFNKLEFRNTHALPMLLLGLVAAANLISTPGAADTTRAIWYGSVTLYLLCSWVFFVGLITRHGFRAITLLMNAYVFAGLFSATVSTLAYFHLIPFQDVLLLYGRPKGLFKDPNVYGPYMIPVAIYAFANINMRGKRAASKAFWICAFFLATAGVFLSFSRACWMSYAVSLTVYFALDLLGGTWKDASRKLLNVSIVLVLLGTTVLASIAIPQISYMMSLRLGSSGLQGYDQDRFAGRLHYERPHEASLELFRAARAATAELMGCLTEADWLREGTHSEVGRFGLDTWLRTYGPHAHRHADQIRVARGAAKKQA